MDIKFSVITPAFNAADFIEDAIQSVLDQRYPYIEHIVIDGGSNDGTVDILKKYDHLKWRSEPDKGQSHAINKGFDISSGNIIGILNADDFYIPEIFSYIAEEFRSEDDFLVGKVKVLLENGSQWINDPKIKYEDMLYHWLPDAYPVNPAGYFFRKEVFIYSGWMNEKSHNTMDLEFLLNAARKFDFRKVDKIFGVFRNFENTKTQIKQKKGENWTIDNFFFIEEHLKNFSFDFRKKFREDREAGYQMRKLQQLFQYYEEEIKRDDKAFLFKLNDYLNLAYLKYVKKL